MVMKNWYDSFLKSRENLARDERTSSKGLDYKKNDLKKIKLEKCSDVAVNMSTNKDGAVQFETETKLVLIRG